MDLDTVDKLLTTTRSVRKRLDFDRPVPEAIIQECLEIAIQAPTGGNRQGWFFMVVTDAQKRIRIAELYKKSFTIYNAGRKIRTDRGEAYVEQVHRVISSAEYLAENMARAPVFILPCIESQVPHREKHMVHASLYGSILPATWSIVLALRARGFGTAWTTLHLRYANEVATIVGIPNGFTQVALLPVAYYKGDDFKPARRIPARDVTWWNTWGERR